jgi:hypothetical protein
LTSNTTEKRSMTSFSKCLISVWESFAQKSAHLIGNLHARIECYTLGDESILSCVVDEITPNCYVASPYSMIVSYAKDEIPKVDSKAQRIFSRTLIALLSALLKCAKIDTIQSLNNYLLSTNFFNHAWEKEVDLETLRLQAIQRHPRHALLLRSINEAQNPLLIQRLQKENWLPLVSRQVYIFSNWRRCQQTHNFQIDAKLANSERFVFIKPNLDDMNAFEEAERLYTKLYLEKYSIHNVHFKAVYLRALVVEKLLHLRLLKDAHNNAYVGVVGLMGESGVITVPIVGYDTAYPQENALYRRLIAYGLSYAMRHDYLLNLSSGAPSFKTLRGAEPTLEYMYVYVCHLSWHRRAIWKMLSLISIHFYGPLLKRFKL